MAVSGEDLKRFFDTHNLRFGKCLDPTMTCGKQAIRAHSIQNSRVIDLLQVNGHVIAFRPKFSAQGPEIGFESIGRNNASTFTGLCSEHDTKLFEPLDTKPLDINNREQLFLLAFRSVTRELHAVMEGAAKIQSVYSSRVDRGIDLADTISPAGAVATQHLLISFFTYQYRAMYYDMPLLSVKFDEIEHDVIAFENQKPCIAVSSLFSIDEVTKVGGDIVRAVLNVLPADESKTLAVFSYTREDRAKTRAALDRVFASQGEYQKYELSKIIIGRIENFLISPSHYDTWSTVKRETIKNAFTRTILSMEMGEVQDHPDLMLF